MNTQDNIREELNSMDSTLANMPGAMPYVVPDGYFEALAGNIIHAINDTGKEVDPNFGKALPYVVPAGYFNDFPSKMVQLNNADAGNTDKIIPLFPRIRWAAAAALVVIIGVGGLMVFTAHNETGVEKMLAIVPQNDIHNYMQRSYGIDASKVLNSTNIANLNVDSKDIEAYLNETGWE